MFYAELLIGWQRCKFNKESLLASVLLCLFLSILLFLSLKPYLWKFQFEKLIADVTETNTGPAENFPVENVIQRNYHAGNGTYEETVRRQPTRNALFSKCYSAIKSESDWVVFDLDGSSRPEVFCRKGVLRNFAKFTGKHLWILWNF